MSVIWLTPLAWWGALAIALPLLIHLLVRHRTRRIEFPSLRFIRETRLAAVRRRALEDWPLLIVRVLVVLTAVGALAAPVVVTPARQAEWASRVAKALVSANGSPASAAVVADEQTSSDASAVFTTSPIVDALDEAVAWLERQPMAMKELVIAGDLRRGMVSDGAFERVPPHVGIRFLPIPGADPLRDVALFAAVPAARGAEPSQLHLHLADDATRIVSVAASTQVVPIAVRAAASDRVLADAALGALLDSGRVFHHVEGRRVLVVFAGADVQDLQPLQPPASAWMRAALARVPRLSGGEHNGQLVVHAPRPSAETAVAVLDQVASAAFVDDVAAREPARIDAATLAAWSRAPGRPPPGAHPGDTGDRRWLWAVALLLLGIEQWLRRGRADRAQTRQDGDHVGGGIFGTHGFQGGPC